MRKASPKKRAFQKRATYISKIRRLEKQGWVFFTPRLTLIESFADLFGEDGVE